jgi:hypothetical protein
MKGIYFVNFKDIPFEDANAHENLGIKYKWSFKPFILRFEPSKKPVKNQNEASQQQE